MIRTTAIPWDELDKETKQRYLRTARTVSQITTSVISPGDKAKAWQSFCDFLRCGNLDTTLPSHIESVLHSLAEAYNNADHWTVRRMVLSILADKLPIGKIQQYIPNISSYAYYQARLHSKEFGAGAVLQPDPQIRIKFDEQQVHHFAWFLASPFVITELPYGEAIMKLSSGERLVVANVIRDRIATRIVDQYLEYCKDPEKYKDVQSKDAQSKDVQSKDVQSEDVQGEDVQSKNFHPLARSTLLKLIRELPASTRTSLAGVDYIVAGGVEAFNSLIRTLDSLVENGLESTEAKELKQKLKSSKQYLLSDLKAHVEKSTPIASHCISNSLSDPNNSKFAVECDHDHDFECDRCSMICDTLKSINAAIVEQRNLDSAAKDELMYTYETAKSAIDELWAHQIKQINQDYSRTECLEELLPELSVHLTMDYAMKWLPIKFRETTRDFYAKKGLSWHVTFALRKSRPKTFECKTFIHIFPNAPQSASTVYCILRNVIQRLQIDMPHLQSVYVRSDNASCYRSAQLLGSLHALSKELVVRIERYDFPDSQAGKSACDRYYLIN